MPPPPAFRPRRLPRLTVVGVALLGVGLVVVAVDRSRPPAFDLETAAMALDAGAPLFLPLEELAAPDGDAGPAPIAAEAPSGGFAFAAYPGVLLTRIAGEANVNGVSMQMATLSVESTPDTVAKFYVARLQAQGLAPLLHKDPPPDAPVFISFSPPDSGELDTLTLVPTGDGTQVFAGRSTAATKDSLSRAAGAKLPPDVPTPSPAQSVVVSEFNESGTRQRNISFTLSKLTPDAALTYFNEALRRVGFRTDPDAPAVGPGALAFVREREQVSLDVNPDGEGGVLVNLLWVQH